MCFSDFFWYSSVDDLSAKILTHKLANAPIKKLQNIPLFVMIS